MPEPEQSAKPPISPEQLAHIGELIAGGAMLVPTDEQVQAMSQQAPTSEWGTVTHYPGSTGETQPVNSAELTAQPEAKTYTDESIKDLIDSTYFATHNYFGVGGETTNLVSYGKNAAENVDLQNNAVNYAADLIKNTSDYKKENSKKFDEAGSPEVVTLLDPRPEYAKVAGQYAYRAIEDACLGLGNDRQKVNGELVKAILYTTSADRRGKYQHYDAHGRGGVRNEFCLVLPASQADSLFAAMQADPLLVRRLGDAMSLQALDKSLYKHGGHPLNQVDGRSPEQVLADSRPPYDEWQAMNDGVNRMAFRTSFTDGPKASNIITFGKGQSIADSGQSSAEAVSNAQ